MRSSDLQSDSDLDSIRNSCDVFLGTYAISHGLEHRALVKGHTETCRPDGTNFLELVLILVTSILILVVITGSLVLFTQRRLPGAECLREG